MVLLGFPFVPEIMHREALAVFLHQLSWKVAIRGANPTKRSIGLQSIFSNKYFRKQRCLFDGNCNSISNEGR
jgi:hypothetical protein